MRADAGQLIPGSTTLRRTLLGNNVECIVHGVRYTPGSVQVNNELVAICTECFEVRAEDVVEPEVAVTVCEHGTCLEPAGDNYCHACGRRYCTKHMFCAGHNGTCTGCMDFLDCSGVPMSTLPCAHGSCDANGVEFCDQCKHYYCSNHMSADFDDACIQCTGEEDDIGTD